MAYEFWPLSINPRLCSTEIGFPCSPCALMKLIFSLFFRLWNYPFVVTRSSFPICFVSSSAFYRKSDPLILASFFLTFKNYSFNDISTTSSCSFLFIFGDLVVSNNRCVVSIIRLTFKVLIFGRPIPRHFVLITHMCQFSMVLICGF